MRVEEGALTKNRSVDGVTIGGRTQTCGIGSIISLPVIDGKAIEMKGLVALEDPLGFDLLIGINVCRISKSGEVRFFDEPISVYAFLSVEELDLSDKSCGLSPENWQRTTPLSAARPRRLEKI